MARNSKLSPNQDMAANPMENVWVQANAGTGKTSVLIQRLLRILFRGDADNGILCLTYTNAAAGEMRNRILAALREWAMAPDDELAAMLNGVSENNPATAADIAHAREIFFRYIDCPEILKIKTIHGFCEEILRRFPLEAGVSPSWSLISDANQRVLQHDAFEKLINAAASDIDPRVNDAFEHIVGRISDTYMTDLLNELSRQYKYFFQVENIDNYRKYFVDTIQKFLNLNIEKPVDASVKTLETIIEIATSEQKSLKKPVKYLEDVITLTKQYIDKTIDFAKYKSAYLNADGTRKSVVSKRDFLADEQERVYARNQYESNVQVFSDTVALFDLSAAFARTYRDMKSHMNVLDFEDLILYTRRLFSDPSAMGWVLSQLDLSLGHILVDEAQDTSPMQWDILRMLAGDFFTDGDVSGIPHSLFVVGDTKQSIYGFQGADPSAFAASRTDIAAHIQNNLRAIREIPLAQSFRSTLPVLHAVDTFFDDAGVVQISGFSNVRHTCFRRDAAGLVEIHPLVSKQTDSGGISEYIRMIADSIQTLVRDGHYSPGDIMVLVQNRHPMVAPLVVELKRRNIDVAGSDRIVLPHFPAVRDLLNLVRFCLTPDDDYSLCCTLKSPIFRLTERDIFNLCSIKNSTKSTLSGDKSVSVFDVLRDVHPDVFATLSEFVQMSHSMAPYSFFQYVLEHNDTRDNFIAALGPQVLDPLEEFMTICLAYERTQPGTLRHFLKWFVTGGSEIKRDMDASSGVRIVTVHGSKGLEAPIVFLIDTVRTPAREPMITMPSDVPEFPVWMWAPRADSSAQRQAASDEMMQLRIAEYYRLLYVAMTRARDRLYIYGFTPYKNAPDVSWFAQLWRVFGNGACTPARITNDDITE